MLQSDNGLRVLVTQAGSNALFVFAGSSVAPGTPAPSTTVSEAVPSPLPTGLAVIVTLLANSLPLDTVSVTPLPQDKAVNAPQAGEVESVRGVVQAGGSDGPDVPEEVAAFGRPFAGPDPIEALEKLRLFAPQPNEELAPLPDPAPKKEAPPTPQGLAPAVAPRDVVWSDMSWLNSSSPVGVAEASGAPADMTGFSTGETGSTRSPEPEEVPSGSPVSLAFALLGLLGRQETWRRSPPEDGRHTRSRKRPGSAVLV